MVLASCTTSTKPATQTEPHSRTLQPPTSTGYYQYLHTQSVLSSFYGLSLHCSRTHIQAPIHTHTVPNAHTHTHIHIHPHLIETRGKRKRRRRLARFLVIQGQPHIQVYLHKQVNWVWESPEVEALVPSSQQAVSPSAVTKRRSSTSAPAGTPLLTRLPLVPSSHPSHLPAPLPWLSTRSLTLPIKAYHLLPRCVAGPLNILGSQTHLGLRWL